MSIYQIEPDIAGEWGEDVDYDPAREPRLVGPFHYVLDSWSGEDLVTTHPFFFVTRRLADAITAAGLTGVEFTPTRVSSEGWVTPSRPELPDLLQLVFTGDTDSDLLLHKSDLRVSGRTIEVLRMFNLGAADIDLVSN